MDGSIHLTAAERKMVLSVYRGGGAARIARRAHILLLLDRGHSYREIMDIDFCSSDLVNHVKRQFLDGGLEAALAEPTEEPTVPFWQVVVAGWLLHQTPRDFGYFRSRWTCELFAELLREAARDPASAEKPSVGACTTWASPGAGRGRWSDRPILTTPRNSGKFADC